MNKNCIRINALAKNKVIIKSLILITGIVASMCAMAQNNTPLVRLQTSMGDIVIQLNKEKAPLSVENFLNYVKMGTYNGTIFHRVIDGFMIQGGGFKEDMSKQPTQAAIQNEANNGLKNLRGTVAMARTNAPHSATSQFFINVVDNDFLNFTSASPRGWGYAVFGKVVQGMEVVDKIKKVKTQTAGGYQDVPVTPIVITHASIVEAAAQ